MCGIFGQACQQCDAKCLENVLIGLAALQYRGYDSCGVAWHTLRRCVKSGHARSSQDVDKGCTKVVGTVKNLRKALRGSTIMLKKTSSWCSIAHTRWATHGAVTSDNTHPHVADAYALVHNGVVENAAELRRWFEDARHGTAHSLQTDTDTELIVKSLALQPLTRSLVDRVRHTVRTLRGANAIAVQSLHDCDVADGNTVVLCHAGLPIIVGVSLLGNNDTKIADEKVLRRAARSRFRVVCDCGDDACAGETDAMSLSPGSIAHTVRRCASHSIDSDDLDAAKMAAPQVKNIGENVCFTYASDSAALRDFSTHTLRLVAGEIAVIDSVRGVCTVHVESHDRWRDIVLERLESVADEHTSNVKVDRNDGMCMWREIHEQPNALQKTLAGRLLLGSSEKLCGSSTERMPDVQRAVKLNQIPADEWRRLRRAQRLVFVGCGTSYHSALAVRPLFERYCGALDDFGGLRSVIVERATPMLDRAMPIGPNDTCIFMSQSGETADTLSVLEHCAKSGAQCIGIVNTANSTLERKSDCCLHLRCGEEIGVASTKAYTCQIALLTLIVAALTQRSDDRQEILRALACVPSAVIEALDVSDAWARATAKGWQRKERCLLIARGADEATCYEAALKIKELCYVLAEGCHAGELKHGPLALVDSDIPIIAFRSSCRVTDAIDSTVAACSERVVSQKMNSAIEQVRARSGRPAVISSQSVASDGDALVLPCVGHDLLQCIINIIPMQLLSFHWAVARGLDVDRPRNLAKSVTVH